MSLQPFGVIHDSVGSESVAIAVSSAGARGTSFAAHVFVGERRSVYQNGGLWPL
jgi:hypothetical protein